MAKTHGTKKALLLSALSLLLCCSMLIGSTFAWFTDSVTSANNIIKSGNLDVELYYQVEGQSDWTKVDANTNIFMEDALWEPGHTEVVKLKVVNEGSLALKYNLGVNIASETGSVNQLGQPFLLSDYIKYGVAEGAQIYTREQAVAAVDATATALKTAYNSGSTELLPKANDTTAEDVYTDIVTMVVYMPTTVGNEANYAKGEAVPTINLGINLFATQFTYEEDSFDELYDKNAIIVSTAAEAQAALDNAAAGATIKLAPGVNYGTLYLRPVAGGAPTKEVDWIGNNYRYETYSLFENLTIVGAAGATVDAIKIEGGTYYNTPHSQSATYPVMLSLVELKNVTIDGITFTGNGGYDPQGYGNVINLSGNNIKVDGLTLKNCVLENAANNARLLYKTESTTTVHTYAYGGETFTFSPTLKDITVTGCTFNGGYMGLELRETENVTITNNTFNVGDRNILLAVNTGCTYSGNITISGNISNNAKERFVRADGTGDAVVVIKNNTLNNYQGADTDYIKVTNGNNVTVENTTMGQTVSSATELRSAMAAADSSTVIDATGVKVEGVSGLNFNGATIIGATFDATGNTNGDTGAGTGTINGTFKDCIFTGNHALRYCYAGETVVFENCVFDADVRGIHFDGGNSKVIFKNCEINGFNAIAGTIPEAIFENCTFGNGKTAYNGLNLYCNTTLTNCVFKFESGKTNFIDMEGNGKTLTITNCTATLDGAATSVSNFVGGSKLSQNTVIYN